MNSNQQEIPVLCNGTQVKESEKKKRKKTQKHTKTTQKNTM